jgi:hypothetical protein
MQALMVMLLMLLLLPSDPPLPAPYCPSQEAREREQTSSAGFVLERGASIYAGAEEAVIESVSKEIVTKVGTGGGDGDDDGDDDNQEEE